MVGQTQDGDNNSNEETSAHGLRMSFVWRVRYRFQLATQWLAYLNFVLLIVAVSKSLGFRALPVLAIAVPVGFLCMYLWGWFLDVFARQQHNDEIEYLKRSPAWKIHMENNEMLKKLTEDK